MKKRVVAAIFVAVLMLAAPACSSGVGTESRGNGTCVLKREKSFMGITYNKQENLINCEE